MRIALAVAIAVTGCSPEEPKSGAFDPAGAIRHTDDGVSIQVHRRDVPLAEMPILPQKLWGLPMVGMATVEIDLTVPTVDGATRYQQATGSIALACPSGCTLGNDRAQLVFGGFGPVDFGHIAFDAVDIRATVHDGRAEITKWEVSSKDVELRARMRIDLDAADLGASKLDGCLWFKPTRALTAARPKTSEVLMITGALQNSDGYYSIRIAGTLGASKRLALECEVN